MQALTDKQKQIMLGKMLNVDSDNCSENESEITTNCIRFEIIQQEILHFMFFFFNI